jgi:hypothetical protein
MMKSTTVSVSINSEPQVVYDFVSNLENLPKFAPSTFPSIKEENGEWIVETPQGRIKVVLAERNNFFGASACFNQFGTSLLAIP